jgi:hypothetical protein
MTMSTANLDATVPSSLERPSDIRGALAILLCAAALGVIAITAVAGNSAPRFDTLPVAALAGGLWLAAILVVAPEVRAEHGVALAGTLLYAVAFTLPAMVTGSTESVPGYLAFFLGWLVVPVAWVANPVFVAALSCYRRERLGAAACLGVLAFAAALTTLAMPWHSSTPGAGFWFWAAAPAILVIAALVRSMARESIATLE